MQLVSGLAFESTLAGYGRQCKFLITGLAGLSVSIALSGLAVSISGSRQSMLVVHVATGSCLCCITRACIVLVTLRLTVASDRRYRLQLWRSATQVASHIGPHLALPPGGYYHSGRAVDVCYSAVQSDMSLYQRPCLVASRLSRQDGGWDRRQRDQIAVATCATQKSALRRALCKHHAPRFRQGLERAAAYRDLDRSAKPC